MRTEVGTHLANFHSPEEGTLQAVRYEQLLHAQDLIASMIGGESKQSAIRKPDSPIDIQKAWVFSARGMIPRSFPDNRYCYIYISNDPARNFRWLSIDLYSWPALFVA
jgi:hypothetical protein